MAATSQRFGDAISWVRDDAMPWVDAPRRCSRGGRLVLGRGGRAATWAGETRVLRPFFPRPRQRCTTRAVLDFGPPSLERFPRAVRCPSAFRRRRTHRAENGSSFCAREDPRCPRVLVASRLGGLRSPGTFTGARGNHFLRPGISRAWSTGDEPMSTPSLSTRNYNGVVRGEGPQVFWALYPAI